MGRQVTLRPRMRTLVISDLHLGSRRPVDILRRPEPLDALCAYLRDVDRLVLLGDILELRHGPAREALAAAQPVFEALGAALPKRAEVVITAGNHDYPLVSPWLAERGALTEPAAARARDADRRGRLARDPRDRRLARREADASPSPIRASGCATTCGRPTATTSTG